MPCHLVSAASKISQNCLFFPTNWYYNLNFLNYHHFTCFFLHFYFISGNMLPLVHKVLNPCKPVGCLLSVSSRFESGSNITPVGQGVGGVSLPQPIRSGSESWFKKGSGGRSSFSGNVVTIFGANGMVGETIVNRLARNGTQIIIPYRCDPYSVKNAKVCGDLGQILFFKFDLDDEESIRKTVKYSNIVINLIGSEWSTKNWSMERVNVDGAARLARISREMGVKKFIHVSALNATTKPTPYLLKNGSEFLRTKALGERAVSDAFPEAVIVRPARLYGHRDRFINLYLKDGILIRRFPPFNYVELYKRGLQTYKLPLHVNDFSSGIEKIVEDPTLAGTTVEFAGPYCYSINELVRYMMGHVGRTVNFFAIGHLTPLTWGKFSYADFRSWLARKHRGFTWEWIENTECTSDRLTPGVLQLPDIGVKEREIFEFASINTIVDYLGIMSALAGSVEERWITPYPNRSPILYKGDGKKAENEKPIPGSPEYYGLG